MFPKILTRVAVVLVTGAALAVAPSGFASGEPQQAAQPRPFDFQGEESHKPDKDIRRGAVAPSSHQQTQAQSRGVRWNVLGTPAVVSTPGTSGVTQTQTTLANVGPEQVGRAYLAQNRELFGLTDAALASLEKVAVNPVGDGFVVLLRQRFGDLPAGRDGLVALGLRGTQVVHVTSTLARDSAAPAPAVLSQQQAIEAAARDAGLDLRQTETKHVKAVAVPTAEGAVSAYQVTLIDAAGGAEPAGYTSYVHAGTGAVLIRENLVDYHQDPGNPHWEVFPGTPPLDYSSTDTRQTWCAVPGPGCDYVAGTDPRTGLAWDVDHATNLPTNTSLGNAARTFENRASSSSFTVGTRSNALRADRNYVYPWTNQWQTAKCDPTTLDTPQEADLEAAIANLHAMHNRMHDWSYLLGFTETAFNMQVSNGGAGGIGGDPEQGNAQAGARFAAIRDNANQITGPDGLAPITNMFLWQPIAGGFYAPCVDGDYDMNVIGHEYTHAISGRMIGGPDTGWSGPQAGAMNESTSDLFSMEYLNEYGFASPNAPYITGEYVTGDKQAGIRNYDMSKSPLNYSDLSYDLVGQQVHADGEIWSATQFDIRSQFVKRYGKGTAAQQRQCADGVLPLTQCPGNRRWVQLSFDALLLMASGAVDYVDHRDALLAADLIRSGGANHDIMWPAFARHGLGSGASSSGPADPDAIPSFLDPTGKNATLTLLPIGEAKDAAVKLYVGDYEARAMPVADTDPATTLGASFKITPGKYSFVATSPGFGHRKFSLFVPAVNIPLPLLLTRNHAAGVSGATATGDGVNQARLIDETEGTNWASLTGPAAGKQVTVDLAGDDAVHVRRVQVSAMLRPPIAGETNDPGGQNRFSALRQFQILGCDATSGADCASDSGYAVIYTSAADAFPSRIPRPRAPELILRSFNLHTAKVTHVRLKVMTSQCTGTPGYSGEQDNDPRSATDCGTASPFAGQVRAAELQVFSH